MGATQSSVWGGPKMCSERDSPLKRLYQRTHAKLARLAGSGQLVWAAGCVLSLALVHALRPAWPGETSSGGPAVQNAAAWSHTIELTCGHFCFRVSRCQRCRGRLVPRSAATPLVKGAHSNWLGKLSSMMALPETCQNSLKFHLLILWRKLHGKALIS